ncbi:MAG TPA: hypothetical protein VFT99_09850, partial [Roseiflexaceae bacterium]|nr:hypothetical protein [Roseiflexaceae bacterium]
MPAARRIAGLFMVGAGTAGLLFSIIGFVLIIRFIDTAQSAIDQRLVVLDGALTATKDGLTVAQQSLEHADSSIGSLETTIDSVNQTITDTIPTLDTLSSVVGDDMPRTIST